MKIERVTLSDDRGEIIFSDVQPHLLNAFRRALMVDVPKMAIDKVEIHLGAISDENGKTYESTTPLFDEIIAHRLGMVPVPTDGDALIKGHLKLEKECDCSGTGCQNCQIMYSLNKRGPSTVYSGDLEQLKNSHICTQYAGYRPIPNITIDQKKINDPERVAANCPKDVFKVSKKSLKIDNLEACILCKACENEDISGKGAINVDINTSRYFFKFETDGAIEPKFAIIYALKVLEAKYSDFQESLAELK